MLGVSGLEAGEEALEQASELVRRAEGYPFDPPLGSWVLRGNEAGRFDLEGRLPLLAIGSNASPSRLREKLGEEPGTLPVLRALLADHVVVYSAHFSRYGSVPATLAAAPGAACYVFVLWPDPRQLERLHESEAVGQNYDFVELPAEIEVEGAGRLRRVHAYVSTAGPLRIGGSPVRLAEVASAGCPWPALYQPSLLRLLHRRLAGELSYEAFLARIVADEAWRAETGRRLRELA